MITLKAGTKLRTAHRDTRIAQIERRVNGWSRRLYSAVLGEVAAHRDNPQVAAQRVKARLARDWPEATAIIEGGLESLLDWSFATGADLILDAVPWSAWLKLYSQQGRIPVGESRLAEKRRPFDLKVIQGTKDKRKGRALIRQYEFPAPGRAEVRRILTDTTAPDAIPWMQRIVTVPQKDMGRLLSTLSSRMAAGDNISEMEGPLRSFINAQNYVVRRIARTESVRVAEAGLRESWKQVDDIVVGIQTWTANDANVRDSHRHYHGKIYRKQDDGTYRGSDGEALPSFPAAPNCRCWSSPMLDPAILQEE